VKFLCNTEFIHSGERSYFSGNVYDDITADCAMKMIDMDKKRPLGALSFFTPVDEEAVNFVKPFKGIGRPIKDTDPATTSDTGGIDTSKAPTRANLIVEAKSIGVKGADRMSIDELKEVIAAKRSEQQQAVTNTPPSPGETQ
jgi:hypothetical protein